MRISAISNSYYAKNNSNTNVAKQNQAFKGLWGKSVSHYHSDEYFESNETDCYYYPFKDETDKEIQDVVDQHSYYEESPWTDKPKYVYEPKSELTRTTVNVCDKLPFTKAEFEKYRNYPKGSLKTAIIDRYIIEKDLELSKH